MAVAIEHQEIPVSASADVEQQLRIIKQIITKLIDTYHKNLVVGQQLSLDFDKVAMAAAEQFTPWQKAVIRDSITMKAIREYPRMGNVSDISAKEMTSLLRHCFGDSCGHVLSYSYKNNPTEEDSINGLKRASWVVQALDDISSNFTMILGDRLEEFPLLKTTLEEFRAAILPLNVAMDKIAAALHIDGELQTAMVSEQIKEKLHDTTSISHLRYISPDSWNLKPI